MLGNMRCTNMTPSDLWKTDIKANSQMSHPPPPPHILFPLKSEKGKAPRALQPSKGKLSASHSWWDFENEATWRQSVSTGTWLVTVTESCHFTVPALMETDTRHPLQWWTLRDVLQACWTGCFTYDLQKHARAEPGELFVHLSLWSETK